MEKAVPRPIEPDALAVVIRDGDGIYRVRTAHNVVTSAAAWGMVWVPLFGVLFFAPVLGMAVGAELAVLMRRVAGLGIQWEFRRDVGELLQPGCSALFMAVERETQDSALRPVAPYGGTILSSPLSQSAQSELQKQFHGAPPFESVELGPRRRQQLT